MADSNVRYFIAKCDHIKRLYEAKDTKTWACPQRQIGSSQPAQILTEAFNSGKVILIFSVNNCHGYHGIATMVTKPGDHVNNKLEDSQDGESRSGSSGSSISCDHPTAAVPVWHYFRIQWEVLFVENHGEQCLPFSATQSYKLPDGSPLNKARNLQELDADIGHQLCQDISGHFQMLVDKRDDAERERIKRLGEPFLPPPSPSCNHGEDDTQDMIWQRLINKVQSLGTVLVACAFGSQRYNLHTADSDVDMFVVYAAHTTAILGLGTPPPTTIKNHEGEEYDYTVHELSRFCELLLSGDPRCVETLYLHPSTIHYSNPLWLNLQQHKQHFLTRQCVEKYLRDATGGKGTKLLDKWTRGQSDIAMTPRIAKLCYIILRLLQNARDVCEGCLCVYREQESTDRQQLMAVRSATLDYLTVREHINKLSQQIESSKHNIQEQMSREDLQKLIESWLIKLRYDDLHKHMLKMTL